MTKKGNVNRNYGFCRLHFGYQIIIYKNYIYIYILRSLFHLIGGLDDKIVNNMDPPPRILLLCSNKVRTKSF